MAGPIDGRLAISIAREAVELGLDHPGRYDDLATPFADRALPGAFEERRGLFVTLTRDPDDRLRGCVGFPFPAYPLRQAIPRAAWAAAEEDPRFPPVGRRELDGLKIEISILTPPEALRDRARRAAEVVVGRDGLIVERGEASGLLLPQVAVEEGWDPERFLSETCRKAGLPLGAWRRADTIVRRFRAELVRERSPRGPVEAHEL